MCDDIQVLAFAQFSLNHATRLCCVLLVQKPGDDLLAVKLYAKLMDRNAGGAFDVLRTYGRLTPLSWLTFHSLAAADRVMG